MPRGVSTRQLEQAETIRRLEQKVVVLQQRATGAEKQRARVWIPVRPADGSPNPPPRDSPIIYATVRRGLPPEIGVGWWTPGGWVPGLQTLQNPDGFTHWLPLPEPPQ
jgi:hypothetical protein